MEKVLVTGGNGFIGRNVCDQLLEEGYEPVVVDWENPVGLPSFTISFDDRHVLGIMKNNNIKKVIHLAADHEVGRSVEEPSVYYNNNVASSIRFLDMCIQAGVEQFIFSSSSSVYDCSEHFCYEGSDVHGSSPYASTKIMFERILRDYENAYGIKTLSFRYFNAAGASPSLRHGYTQEPATHLFPTLARCFLRGSQFTIHGDDYKTDDGTCIRDYTHVEDIARAHTYALRYQGPCSVFNLGLGEGYSVKQIVEKFERYTGKTIPVQIGQRRVGDDPRRAANSTLACQELNWKPKWTIDDMVKHAYEWENIRCK